MTSLYKKERVLFFLLPKDDTNLFLGVSDEVDVGQEDCEVDHRVEGDQPGKKIQITIAECFLVV